MTKHRETFSKITKNTPTDGDLFSFITCSDSELRFKMRFSTICLAKRTLGHKLRFQSSDRNYGFKDILRKNEYIFKPLPLEPEAPTVNWELLDPVVDNEEKRKIRPPKKIKSTPFHVTPENKFEIISRVICPLAHLPYDEQLKSKYGMTKHLMQEVGRKMRIGSDRHITVDSHGLPCPIGYPIESPRVIEYRNKDEFSIWTGVDGNPKTVGFFVGTPRDPENLVLVEPDELIITKKSHRHLASLFQKYLREVSPLDVCFNFDQGGHWRQFIVRSNELGEHMIIGQFHPQNLNKMEIEEEMKNMNKYFTSISSDINVASVYMQAARGARRGHDSDPFILISGKECLTESVLEKQFSLSPESFFQVNTLGAEVLFQTIVDELRPTKDMTVIDIGSGTGVIALTLAPYVRRVIGIEQSGRAVEDAKKNATMNNIKNVTWIQGKAEETLPRLLDEYYSSDVAVVCNPGRGGLRSSVISSIREMEQIKKVIYVSCKPGGDAMKNFVHLSLKGSYKQPSLPFHITNVQCVDLFPQTGHIELVLSFERFV